MKIIKTSFCVIFTFILFQMNLFAANDSEELKNLYDNKRYFELSEKIQKSNFENSTEILFYKGAVCNKFNQLDQSIQYINQYLKDMQNNTEAKHLKECYELLADNYYKSYQYKKAVEAYKTILEKFTTSSDSEYVDDIDNSIRLWKAFSDTPRQSVILNGDTKIKMIRDKAGLTNLPITIGTDSINFIFDTGANISTVTRSTAVKLGFKIYEDSIKVGTITGIKVYASLGVAPVIKIGNATIKNAVFLVVKDKDLEVSQINYQVNGIIGFPVIEGLKEITITQSDSFLIPQKIRSFSLQNMCLDDLSPIVMVGYNGKNLSFRFDTGARSTDLFDKFYRENESFIKANFSQHEREIVGGGGSEKHSVYEFKKFTCRIGSKEPTLEKVSVFTEPLNNDHKYFYGNIGQDVIKKFDKMTMNFVSMSLIFE